MARKRLRPRTLIVTAIVFLLLAGLVAGFDWVYERGLKREGLYERARRACAEGRHDEALALARETLVSEPGREGARELILEALVASGRAEDARAEARRYLEESPDRTYAAVRLCQLAMRAGDGDEAERLARTFADSEPAYAYHVLAVVRDFRGLSRRDAQQRLDAASLMRSFASVTENDAGRADAMIFSAEVSREVAPALPHGELIAQRAEADLKDAAAAVAAAVQANKSYPYELAMGRIRILSSDPEEAALGAKMLRTRATGTLRQDIAVQALARYHIGRGEWSDASDLARSLEDPYLWLRLCWLVRGCAQPEQAAALLESGPFAATPDAVTLRAELLVRSGDPARREEATRSLVALVENPDSPPEAIVRALIALAAGAGADVALASAQRGRVDERDDPRLTALLAALLAAQGSEKGVELAERLARETDEMDESRDLMALLGGRDALDRYVDVQVGKGGDAEARYRLQRAFTLLARAKAAKGDQGGAEELRRRVRADLDALRASGRATKHELIAGFQLAASIGEAELAGEFVARALTLPGDPTMLDVRLLAFARRFDNADALGRIAAGMRAAAAALPARAFIETLADGVASPGKLAAKALIARLEQAANDSGSRLPALELAALVAVNDVDTATAERLARAALATDPRSPAALEVVGSVLLRRGAAEEVLSLHASLPAEARSEASYAQIARAHLLRGKKDEAVAVGREAVRRFPGSASSYLLLAQIHRDRGDARTALSVLSLAPANSLVVHLRAELHREVGDLVMAERLYQVLLSSSGFSDLVAWQGLMETLTTLKRTSDFVALSGRALEGGRLKGSAKAAAALYCMRGACLETEGKAGQALVDYEAAIRLDGTNATALNNAAWQIARSTPARVADARAYADRAMKLNPDSAAVLDTAAEVRSVQEEMEGALSLMDRVLELAPAAKVASYTVHKAEILCRGGREEEAKALIEEVRRKHEGDPAAQRARSLLWEIERKHLPEEEPAQLPAVAEEEEQRPGTGGGE
jgi:tetratricopeptide (TPR) repeat protein